MDATGPSDLFELRSEKSSSRSAAMTVPPEARIGSHEPVSAAQVAFHLVGSMARASLNLAMYSNE